jgi:hypothetical protein
MDGNRSAIGSRLVNMHRNEYQCPVCGGIATYADHLATRPEIHSDPRMPGANCTGFNPIEPRAEARPISEAFLGPHAPHTPSERMCPDCLRWVTPNKSGNFRAHTDADGWRCSGSGRLAPLTDPLDGGEAEDYRDDVHDRQDEREADKWSKRHDQNPLPEDLTEDSEPKSSVTSGPAVDPEDKAESSDGGFIARAWRTVKGWVT